MRIGILLAILILIIFGSARIDTATAAAKTYTCESCPINGIDFSASTALGKIRKESGCRVRKGVGGLPMQDPECTPGAFNPTVTADILRSGRYRTGCVRNCVTTQAQKQVVYERYGVHKDRATCELDHLVPLELGGADTPDNIWPECGPVNSEGLRVYYKMKDAVEDYLTSAVKSGRMQLREAQEGIAKDWTQYRDVALKYCAVHRCGEE